MIDNIILPINLTIERSISDLRTGVPIIIKNNDKEYLVISPETVDENLFNLFLGLKGHIIIPAARTFYILKKKKITETIKINLQNITFEDLDKFIYLPADISDKVNEFEISNSFIENISIKLMKIAELLPSVFIAEIRKNNIDDNIYENITKSSAESIENYSANEKVKFLCSSKIVLRNAQNANMLAFRSLYSNKEHYAITIGNIDNKNPIIVRIHSSCYTGDLLDSLKCDCRNQLIESIDIINKYEGGIILYMMQEGRNIGLTNKLRAYFIQEQGFNTVEANRILGFDDDERSFSAAAEILKYMKIKNVKILSNNPNKSESLSKLGINVISNISSVTEIHQHNFGYLKTKSDLMNHNLFGVKNAK